MISSLFNQILNELPCEGHPSNNILFDGFEDFKANTIAGEEYGSDGSDGGEGRRRCAYRCDAKTGRLWLSFTK